MIQRHRDTELHYENYETDRETHTHRDRNTQTESDSQRNTQKHNVRSSIDEPSPVNYTMAIVVVDRVPRVYINLTRAPCIEGLNR